MQACTAQTRVDLHLALDRVLAAILVLLQQAATVPAPALQQVRPALQATRALVEWLAL